MRLKRVKVWASAVVLICLVGGGTAYAMTTITQGYASKEKLSLGSIVSLERNSSDRVSASTTANSNSILGVVVGADNSLLSLSTNQSNQVQVATGGLVQVLVSDINGAVQAGDQVTSSPISGVGMKATTNTKVVGISQGDLSTSSNKQTVTDKKGEKRTVVLGQIPVLVNVSYYFKEPEKTIIPAALQNIANTAAGKTVKPLPIIVSLVVFLIMLFSVTSIIYSMIHSSIISVGRNPMSQAAIYRNLIQLSVLVLGIVAVGIITIYMVITRF